MKWRAITVLMLVILLVNIIPISVTSENTDNTIYVDDDNTTGPWDGSMEYPYQYIQDGIDNAKDDDTVFVYSGVYFENIIINNTINLVGKDRDTTIIDGNYTERHVVEINADDVYLEKFTIQKGGHLHSGIIVTSSRNRLLYNRICWNERGIILQVRNGNGRIRNYRNVISNNIFENNSFCGITTNGHNFCEISDNIFKNNDRGISLSGFSNIIEGNYVINSTGSGITLHGSFAKVYNNEIRDNKYIGLHINQGNFNNIIENNFINNGEPETLQANYYICIGNKWKRNYWNPRWFVETDSSMPYIIFPYVGIIIPVIPFNLDWNPASEPYNIPFPEVPT